MKHIVSVAHRHHELLSLRVNVNTSCLSTYLFSLVASQAGLKPGGFFVLKENIAKNGMIEIAYFGICLFSSLSVSELYSFSSHVSILCMPHVSCYMYRVRCR